MKKIYTLILLIMVLMFMVACSDESTISAKKGTENVESGGVLNVAINAQPELLDPHSGNSTIIKEISRHMYEGVFALNKDSEVEPMLAKSFEVSDDQLTYTIHLREGVLFHNGKEMLAEDVVASMNRWFELSSPARNGMGESAKFVEKDKYTVELQLEKAAYGVLDILASPKQFAAIMPKEIVESTKPPGVKEFVGTGPFKFEEWKQDQYILLTKYEDYQAVDTPASGLAGSKEALVDELYFHIVTDASTRLAGLQSGQYDYAFQLPADNYEMISNSQDLNEVLYLYGGLMLHFDNTEESPFKNKVLRKAVATALNYENVMMGATGNKDLYRLDPGFMYTEQKKWHTTAGEENYNLKNPEKAKALLKEAGYNGEEFVLLTNRDYAYMYNAAVVIQEELSSLGMNVKLEVTDWATFIQYFDEEESKYDMAITSWSPSSLPTQLVSLNVNAGYPYVPADDKFSEMLGEFRIAGSDEEAYQIWEDVQKHAWDEVPSVKLGEFFEINAERSNVVEGSSHFQGIVLWNTSVKK